MKTLYLLPILAVAAVFAVSCDPDDPVDNTISVNSVSVSPTTLTLLEGENAHLSVTILPKDADDQAVTWNSSNSSVASVADGLVIGIAEGEADITVTTHDGGFTDACHVTVVKKVIKVTGVTLDKTTLDLIVGEEFTLTATVAPENADIKNVTWTSDKPDVATVSEGLVKAVAAGSANITVKTIDGEFTATCEVAVSEPVLSVKKMEVEALPDMTIPRADFALFYCGDELVAAGGHSTGFDIQSSAEYYKDGEWHGMQMKYPHDMPFFTKLSDGKWLVGGGCASGSGIGQTEEVDVYDPSSHSFSKLSAGLYYGRALTRAYTLGNGDVLVSGNWYGSDCIEMYSSAENKFSYVKDVYVERSYPYMLGCASDNAVVFGTYTNYGSEIQEVAVDRYKGDSYLPDLFESWRPLGLGAGFMAENCMIGDASSGDYSYMIGLYQGSYSERRYALGLVKNGEFSQIPTDLEVPGTSDYGQIYYAGPVIVDKSKKTGYMFGSTGEGTNVVCFILKIEYADALSGGKAKLSLYYSDPISSFPGSGGQSSIVLMPDGRLLVAGGIYNSNYSPFSCVYAFKPF